MKYFTFPEPVGEPVDAAGTLVLMVEACAVDKNPRCAVATVDLYNGDLKHSDQDLRLARERDRKRFIEAAVAKEPAATPEALDAALRQLNKRCLAAMRERVAAGDAPAARGGVFFSESGSLLAETLTRAVLAAHPAALTPEGTVALYDRGVYRTDKTAFKAAVRRLLAEDFRAPHRATVEESALGMLYDAGRRLPSSQAEPLLNGANGMLDLRTLELHPHDPAYLSSTQIPVPWLPDAACPEYDAWIVQVAGEQAASLEETASTMLDPSRTPLRALFLYGPPRSGKGTFLRIMRGVAGAENASAVTLHQLAENRFAAANLYGKMLNTAGDLSARHVDDLSLFKQLTGEDEIQADRKYGQQFSYTNRGLLGFSANEIPTVGETSRAYQERVRPFRLAASFVGQEDPSIEARILAHELPGVLVRWAKAYQTFLERGAYLPLDPAIRAEFETRSDRVRQWFEERCRVVAEGPWRTIASGGSMTSRRDLALRFNMWAEQNGGARMGERKILDRLAHIPGVHEVRDGATKTRGLNIVLRPESEWGDGPSDAPDAGDDSETGGAPPGVGRLSDPYAA